MTLRVGMRWKLVVVLVGTLTVLFALVSVLVLSFATGLASDRIVEELRNTAVGGAEVIDGDAFEKLTKLPAVSDPQSESGYGYPDDPLYENSARELWNLRSVVPTASPYTYFRDPVDGQMYFASSYGYFTKPRFGVPFRMPVADVAQGTSFELMAQGLEVPTNQPAYSDEYGSWISTYAPIRNGQGEIVGAIGVDYPRSYVQTVRANVTERLYWMFALIYAVLLIIVLVITRGIVRPLRRLHTATRRIADGDYGTDISTLVKTRFPDEMSELAGAFAEMASKVAAREESLTVEVERLRVEIDQTKRAEAVSEIVDSDFFADLTSKAQALRQQIHSDDDNGAEGAEGGNNAEGSGTST